MMFRHYNCLLFIIIPPMTDVHVIQKRIECEKRVLSVIYSSGSQSLYTSEPVKTTEIFLKTGNIQLQ